MISWHNAPRYEYEGFVYRPDVDEYDDGVRKAWHNVYKAGREYMMHALPEFVIDETPYRWLDYDEFTYHVDVMCRNVWRD